MLAASLLKRKVGKLLQYVIEANDERVEKIVDAKISKSADPNLMFEAVQLTQHGQTEKISPLGYAFKVYDTYTRSVSVLGVPFILGSELSNKLIELHSRIRPLLYKEKA